MNIACNACNKLEEARPNNHHPKIQSDETTKLVFECSHIVGINSKLTTKDWWNWDDKSLASNHSELTAIEEWQNQDDEGMTKPLEWQNQTEIKTEIVTKIKTNPVYKQWLLQITKCKVVAKPRRWMNDKTMRKTELNGN